MLKNKQYYLGWMITIVTSYILIKVVNNYQGVLNIIGAIFSMLSPFIFGLLLTYILSPIVTFLEKKLRFKRWMSLCVTHGFMILVAVVFVFFVIPGLTTNLLNLITDLPNFANDLSAWIINKTNNLEFLKDPQIINSINKNIQELMPMISNFIASSLNEVLSITVSITNIIINIVLSFLISIYLLLDREKVIAYFKRVLYVLLKEKKASLIIEVINTFNSTVGRYIIAKSIDSFCVGVVSTIGLSLIGSKYAFLLGIVCGITNMIPYFGPLLGMIPVVLVNIFYSLKVALFSFIFLLILQQIEGNIIEPKFVGGQLGLRPALTLLAVTIGGGLFGLVGMVLSVPIAAVIKIYTDRMLDKYDPTI